MNTNQRPGRNRNGGNFRDSETGHNTNNNRNTNIQPQVPAFNRSKIYMHVIFFILYQFSVQTSNNIDDFRLIENRSRKIRKT